MGTVLLKLIRILTQSQAVKDLGAVLFDYKKPIEHQVKEVMSITSGKPFRIFDAAATGDALAKELFKVVQGGEKLFTTTNDWSVPKFRNFPGISKSS